MREGHLEASGHNWVEGQGSGPRIDKADGDQEDQYDAMGNKIDLKKKKKMTAADARKAKKDRMARRKRGEEVFSDEEWRLSLVSVLHSKSSLFLFVVHYYHIA